MVCRIVQGQESGGVPDALSAGERTKRIVPNGRHLLGYGRVVRDEPRPEQGALLSEWRRTALRVGTAARPAAGASSSQRESHSIPQSRIDEPRVHRLVEQGG